MIWATGRADDVPCCRRTESAIRTRWPSVPITLSDCGWSAASARVSDMVGNLVVNVATLRHAELGDLWPVSAVRDIGSLVGIWPNGCRRPRLMMPVSPWGQDATRTADDVRRARQSPSQNILAGGWLPDGG